MKWLVARLKEPSTWRGLVWLLTAFGVTFRPEVWEQITAVGMAAAGLVGVLTSEENRPAPIELVSTHLSDVADRRPSTERVRESVPPDTGPESSGWNG